MGELLLVVVVLLVVVLVVVLLVVVLVVVLLVAPREVLEGRQWFRGGPSLPLECTVAKASNVLQQARDRAMESASERQ